MRIFKNNKGYTETELMMVFALIALFGILCFTLIQAGGGAYERLAENRSNKAFARVALSYIESRVRQGDTENGVYVTSSPVEDGESALVISGVTGVPGEELWIAKNGDELVEYYIMQGDKIDSESYFTIADIESFSVEKRDEIIELTIGYMLNGEIKIQSRIISLRSSGGR